jgi:hypothetical protein
VLERCVLTVRGEIPNSLAMALFDFRRATRRAISNSRYDRAAAPAGYLQAKTEFIKAVSHRIGW